MSETMPINLPDEWGVKKERLSKRGTDVTPFIVFALFGDINRTKQGIPYVKRSDVPHLDLGDLVYHNPIMIVDTIVSESRLGDSGYDEMIEYWVLNGTTFKPDASDRIRHKKIMERLKSWES